MSLVEKQDKFSLMVAQLLLKAKALGYQVTLSWAYVNEEANKIRGGHPKSLHMLRLAIDINLFKDGKFLQNTEDYRELGEYWESIGGTWGGRWGDGNHFSLAHGGMK